MLVYGPRIAGMSRRPTVNKNSRLALRRENIAAHSSWAGEI